MDAAIRQRGEQIEIEVSEIADIVDPVRRLAMAEARMIGRDHGEVLRERRQRVGPARQALHTMQEQHRLARAVAAQEELRASYIDESLVHQWRSPWASG